MADTKTYANFNTLTITGVVSNVKIVDGKYGEFAEVTVISNMGNTEDSSVSVVAKSRTSIKALVEKDAIVTGRVITLTGHLMGVSECYEKDGEFVFRKRPQIKIDPKSAQLTLGASPKGDTPQRAAAGTRVIRRNQTQAPAVDAAPTFGDNAVAEEGAF